VNAKHLEGKSFFVKKDLEGKPETAPKEKTQKLSH